MAAPSNEYRDRLARRLRELRAATGRSGNAFKAAVGMSQPKVSKLERGAQLPSDADLQLWAHNTEPEALEELRALLQAARVEYLAFRDTGRGSGSLAAEQARIEQVESGLASIDEYQPSLVPGLAQTGEYATAVFALPPANHDPADVAEAVGIRRRRGDVLFDSRRRTRLIVGEAALWASPGGSDLLQGQLVRLEMVASLPAVEFGVLPLSAMPVLPVASFRIYDGTRAVLETISGEHVLREPEDVQRFIDAFALLRERAALGDQAIERLKAVRRALTLDDT